MNEPLLLALQLKIRQRVFKEIDARFYALSN